MKKSFRGALAVAITTSVVMSSGVATYASNDQLISDKEYTYSLSNLEKEIEFLERKYDLNIGLKDNVSYSDIENVDLKELEKQLVEFRAIQNNLEELEKSPIVIGDVDPFMSSEYNSESAVQLASTKSGLFSHTVGTVIIDGISHYRDLAITGSCTYYTDSLGYKKFSSVSDSSIKSRLTGVGILSWKQNNATASIIRGGATAELKISGYAGLDFKIFNISGGTVNFTTYVSANTAIY